MPFTVSHIAAVLPGYRWFTRANIFSAAVIGSMVPDFGLLAPGFLARWQTHSLEALFTFCLPVGLATYWLTLLLLRPNLRPSTDAMPAETCTDGPSRPSAMPLASEIADMQNLPITVRIAM